jgi:hypothetical protein
VRVDRAAAPSSHANEATAAGATAGGGEVAYDHTRSLFLGEADLVRGARRASVHPPTLRAVNTTYDPRRAACVGPPSHAACCQHYL